MNLVSVLHDFLKEKENIKHHNILNRLIIIVSLNNVVNATISIMESSNIFI